MLILLGIMCIGLFILGLFIYSKFGNTRQNNEAEENWADWTGFLLSVLNAIGFFVIVIFAVCHIVDLSNEVIIDDKIAVYQEQNLKIENEVSLIVNKYMEFEKDTYGQFTNEGSIVLIQLFPELNSNELIKSQIELYVSNNDKITELKLKKLNYKVKKYWLYFGR